MTAPGPAPMRVKIHCSFEEAIDRALNTLPMGKVHCAVCAKVRRRHRGDVCTDCAQRVGREAGVTTFGKGRR